jgi:hypothetical protein
MTDLSNADLGDQAEALREQVSGLRVDVSGLREDMSGVRERLGSAEGRLWWALAAAVVALALAVGIGVTAIRVQAANARLDSLCPVFALVVGGADPSTRPAGPARDAYIRSMDIMRTSYDQLGCRDIAPLVPKRVG